MKMLEKSEVRYEAYDDAAGLSASDRNLLEAAVAAARSAYAPYSDFRVGAAILLENGRTVTGSNQENAAYPGGLCAERVAAFQAAHAYPGQPFEAVAVAAFRNDMPHPATPCGPCRQVLLEYEYRYGHDTRFIMTGDDRRILIVPSIRSLLPFSFSPGSLGPPAKG
jgi:cytidine deaminase